MTSARSFTVTQEDLVYFAGLLLDKDYTVTDTSRDARVASFGNLAVLGIKDRVALDSMVLTDFGSAFQTLKKAELDGHLDIDDSLCRRSDITYSAGNATPCARWLQ
jgi:GDPmannose 4,6-dehydratase